MRLVDQSFEIIGFDDIKLIEVAGRTCYKSEHKITEGSAERFAVLMRKKNHGAMLEFGSAAVKIVTSRAIANELVRHRIPSYAQESTRYVNYKGDSIAFVTPHGFDAMSEEAKNIILNNFDSAEIGYKALLSAGVPPEVARDTLPLALKTEIVINTNFREWLHIFATRAEGTTGRPHPHMQDIMLDVQAAFAANCPAVFGAL